MNHKYQIQELSKKRCRSNAGFSLIELMVVVAIIAMLAGAVGVAVFDSLDDASVSKAKSEISSFKTALMAYRISLKQLPSTSEGLEVLINNEKRNFLDTKELPMDPWGNPYIYTLEDDGSFIIVSYGKDGVPGGTGVSADISSDSLSE